MEDKKESLPAVVGPVIKIEFIDDKGVEQIKEVVGKYVEEAEDLTREVDRKKEKESRKVKRKSKVKESKKTFKKVKTDSDTSWMTPKIRVGNLPISTKEIYHSRKWVPIEGFEAEKEDYNVDWMMEFMGRKLDDIVDLNLGEKTMMNLWNKHIVQYKGRGICHMDKIAKDFLMEKSHIIVEQNLYRNYVTHLCGLHHMNAITRETLFSCISNMQEVMQVLDETKTVVGPTWISQHEAAVKISDSSRDHSHSYGEKDLETASCLSQPDKLLFSVRNKVLPKRDMKRKVDSDETIHVLTEEPPNHRDFIKMQMDVRIQAATQVKNLDPSKVVIINVGDDIAESIEDIKVSPPNKKKVKTSR